MNEIKVLYFLQPYSDQIISIVKLLREEKVDINLVAVIDNEKTSKKIAKKLGYSYVVKRSDISLEHCTGKIVPGGASSTSELLIRSSVVLGSIVLSQKALIVYDKKKFLGICKDNNCPIPTEYHDFSSINKSDFPIFYKQKYEKGGGVRGIAYSYHDVPDEEIENLVFQEYINSPGTYGVGFISMNGEILAFHIHYEKISRPVQGGSAVVIEKFYDQRLTDLTRKIVSVLDYSGWGLAEFKYCPKRKNYVFMEINAKFWASCELAFRNDPRFLNLLFGVDYSGCKVNGLVYLNRALSIGLMNAIKLLLVNRSYKLVRYPSLLKSLVFGALPNFVLSYLKYLKLKIHTLKSKD